MEKLSEENENNGNSKPDKRYTTSNIAKKKKLKL